MWGAKVFLKNGGALESFVDQILFLLENLDDPLMNELFDRETNLGKKHSVFILCPASTSHRTAINIQ